MRFDVFWGLFHVEHFPPIWVPMFHVEQLMILGASEAT
jgi:hypothetical protein